MRRVSSVAAVILAVLTASTAGAFEAPPLGSKQSAANMKAHMAFLSDDLLLGREAGSEGFRIAANYVAAQFAQLGLKPAGDNGTFFQRVPLVAYRNADQGSLVLLRKGGSRDVLVFGEDYLPGLNVTKAERELTAPLVFVGFGVVAPERKRDDYRGLDVRGKLVVVLSGAPSAIPDEERAYYGSAVTKRLEAAKRGAVGILLVNQPSDEERRPFKSGVDRWQAWGMAWRAPDGTPFDPVPTVPTIARVSVQGAQKLFADASTGWAQILAAAKKPAASVPRFTLPASLALELRTEFKEAESANVAGLIEGGDPLLRNETVVLTAHLDHIGTTPSLKDDPINNGAMDNAAGVATLLEVARGFRESATRPRRSVLVMAVTAEEKGLVGSDYYARSPTIPIERLVAVVNLDMPILTYEFTDVIAFGAERSSIGPAVRRAAERVHVSVSPDPQPEEAVFIRSDHYRFVQQGVPAVYLATGFQNGGEERSNDFLKNCYHRPCDDLSQAISYQAAGKFALLNYEIARELADFDERPAWNKGDFFGTKFERKPQAQHAENLSVP